MRGGICRGRIMEDGGQKSRGAGGGGAVKEIRKEEDTKQLGWSLSHSLSLTSLSHQSSHLSSLLSQCPRVCLSQSFVLFVERERKEGILYCWLCCFLCRRARVVKRRTRTSRSFLLLSFSLLKFLLFFIYYIILYYLYIIICMYTQLVAFGRPAPHSCMPECLTSPRVQTQMDDFSLVYLFFLVGGVGAVGTLDVAMG